MTRESFPEIPLAALRSHAEPERVERVWRRLSLDLAGPPRSRAVGLWWAPLVAAGVFALGVAVGARWYAPAVEVAAVAEPRAALPTPGGGPVAEAAAPAEPRPQAPVRKQSRSRHPVPVEAATADSYVQSYGEPSGVPSEPATLVDSSEWEKLAEAGDFRAARTALDREGGFERALSRASASQLLVLADVARASGNREQAAQALRRVGWP